MKRILSAIIITATLFTACSEGLSFTPGISFITSEPEVLEETAIFRIIGQPFESADSVKIPVTFGGSAEMGVDYETSAEHFTFTSESLTDSIVISTKVLGTGKTVSLEIHIPEGFTAGKYTSSGFTLQDKFGMLTFSSEKGYIADTTEYSIFLTDIKGNARALSKNCMISLSVNKEKSTAIEGVDFEFIGTSQTSIPGGASFAKFSIAPIGDAPAEGKDKIVFDVNADERFDIGPVPEMELNILKSSLGILDGNWKIDTLVTDSLYFRNIWENQCTAYSLVPEFNSSDAFSLSFSDATFTPTFRSGLKTYFIGTSTFEFGDEIDITDSEGTTKKVQLLALNKTNRFFSADTTSTDSLSFVGIHLMKDSETQADMAELYILDHTSMSFMPELESGMKYGTEKPVATTPGMYLEAIFQKRK